MAHAIRQTPCRVKGFKALGYQLKDCIAQSPFDCTLANIPLGDRRRVFCTNNSATHICVNLPFFLFRFPLTQNMSIGFSVSDIYTTFKVARKVYDACRTASEEFEFFSLEVASLTTTLVALEQCLSSDSEAPVQGLSFSEPATLDCKTTLKQALKVLKRYHDLTSKGGSRFKVRHKGCGRQEMKIVREIDGVREGRERLRIFLLTLQADHQYNSITHSTIVSAPNQLNMNISINKGFCDNSVKSTLNGGLFPIQDTCLATLHKNEDPHREFFKHRMTTRNTTAHPRPVSDLKRLCWLPEAKSESRTCPQHPAFPDSKLEHFLHRIRKALPLNISSLAVFLSPLFFAPSVGALAPGCVSTHDRVSWVQALRSTQTNLISVSPY